jgi:penicillin amidase
LNPARGFIATANNNIHPKGFPRPVMFKTATSVPFDRITRLQQMLSPDGRYSIADHRRMQLDTLHLRALSETKLFKDWSSATPLVERARKLLASWDGRLERHSAAAALHDVWRGISTGPERDPGTPLKDRVPMHEASLTRAIGELIKAQGEDWTTWRWGRLHTRAFPFPLLPPFGLPTVERPGGTGSVAADGASYREIMDVANWDRSIVTNVPGQSAQPESPFFENLLKLWAEDVYFPMVYSKAAVTAASAHRLVLRGQ